jgi:hypothetical protein
MIFLKILGGVFIAIFLLFIYALMKIGSDGDDNLYHP